jgi:hypothetical protein
MIDLTSVLGTYAPIPIITNETTTVLSLDVNYIVRAIILVMGIKFILVTLTNFFKCFQR